MDIPLCCDNRSVVCNVQLYAGQTTANRLWKCASASDEHEG
jgi:hypothetical protein